MPATLEAPSRPVQPGDCFRGEGGSAFRVEWFETSGRVVVSRLGIAGLLWRWPVEALAAMERVGRDGP